MNKTLKSVLNIVTWLLIAIAVLFAALLVGGRVLGFQPVAMLSGSMEPEFRSGDLIYVKPADPFALKEGDIITYRMSQSAVATHRIVNVVPDEADASVVRFQTEGDTLVHYKNVIGTPRFALPLLGFAVAYVSSPPGMYVAVGLGVLLTVLVFLPDPTPGKARRRGRFERLDG